MNTKDLEFKKEIDDLLKRSMELIEKKSEEQEYFVFEQDIRDFFGDPEQSSGPVGGPFDGE